MGPERSDRGTPQNTPTSAPLPESNAAEAKLALNLDPHSKELHLTTCRAIANCASRGLDPAELRKHALTPVVALLVTTEDRAVRREAISALGTIAPELASGAKRFAQDLDVRFEARRRESYAATPNRPESPVPREEQILIAARWLTAAIYLGRTFPNDADRASNKLFADAVFRDPRALGTIEARPDELSAFRPTLPRDLIDAQENLDSLVPLKLLPARVVIARFVRSKAAAPGSMHTAETNHLLGMLGAQRTYEGAIEIVMKLGAAGDARGVQAIQQARHGLVSDTGALIQFANESERVRFGAACAEAIACIQKRYNLA